ncbi:MAG: sulfurtransferase TusA family protein, partial [bacterium]
MSEKIDVRGLSCPLPVVTVRKKLLEMKNGVLEVLV